MKLSVSLLPPPSLRGLIAIWSIPWTTPVRATSTDGFADVRKGRPPVICSNGAVSRAGAASPRGILALQQLREVAMNVTAGFLKTIEQLPLTHILRSKTYRVVCCCFVLFFFFFFLFWLVPGLDLAVKHLHTSPIPVRGRAGAHSSSTLKLLRNFCLEKKDPAWAIFLCQASEQNIWHLNVFSENQNLLVLVMSL